MKDPRRGLPPPPSKRAPEGNLSRAAGNASLLMAGGGIAYLLSVAFAIIVARGLGPSLYGTIAIAVTATVVLEALAPFGTVQGVIRYVAIYRGTGDLTRLRGTVRHGVRVTILGGVSLCALVIVAALVIASHDGHLPELAPVLAVLALSLPMSAVADVLLGAVQAHTRVTSTVAIRSFGAPALRVLGTFGAVTVLHSAVAVAGAYTFAEMVGLLLAVVAALRVLPGREAGTAPADPAMTRFSRPLALSRVLSATNANTELFVLGFFAAAGQVALFAAAARLAIIAWAVLNAFGVIFSPIISDLFANGDREQLRRLYRTVCRWALTIGIPVFLAEALFGRLLLSVFGHAFVGAGLALAIMAAGQLVNFGTGTSGSMLTMTGHSKLMLANSVGYLIVSVGVDLALIPRYGLLGAATANAISMAAASCASLIEVWLLTGMQPYAMQTVKPLVAGIVAGATGYAARLLLPTDRAGLAAGAALMLMVYALCLGALRLSPDDRAVLHRLKVRFRSRKEGVAQASRPKREGVDVALDREHR